MCYCRSSSGSPLCVTVGVVVDLLCVTVGVVVDPFLCVTVGVVVDPLYVLL